LATHGWAVHVQRDASPPPSAGRALGTVEVIGHDRPGIVREISQVLAQHQVNVEELTTDCDSAPMSGERLFRATARVRLPAAYPLAELRHALEQIASDLMVDIAVKPDPGP
jgi:glycine cleavage system regulatory protein